MAKRMCSFMIDPELAEGLKALKRRGGASEGESIRRALADYLKKRATSAWVAPQIHRIVAEHPHVRFLFATLKALSGIIRPSSHGPQPRLSPRPV